MSCGCMSELERQLELKGKGYKFHKSLRSIEANSADLSMKLVWHLPIERLDGKRLGATEPKNVSFAFCPFCGTRFEDEAAQESEAFGTVHPSATLFFVTKIGTATGKGTGEGFNYTCMHMIGTGGPALRSEVTGKWFTITWQDIVDLARIAGIDEPETGEEASRG